MDFVLCYFRPKVRLSLLIAICCLLFCGCNDEYQETLHRIHADEIKTYSVTARDVSDREFHNDGSTVYEFSNLQKSEIDEVLNNNTAWGEYCLDSPVNLLLYGGKYDSVYYSPITMIDAEISDGYYFFVDLQNEKENYSLLDIVELYNRASMDYVLAIIDVSANKLYYFQYNS